MYRRKKRWKLLVVIAVVLLIYGRKHYCSSLEPNPYLNNLAHFLAGMPFEAGEDSAFKKLTGSPEYLNHAKAMNTLWNQVRNENIRNISAWREKNIDDINEKNTAFYPFSGADFVNVYSFFPGAKEYIMVALEQPGIIPDPLRLKEPELAAGLTAIERCIETIASRNYLLSRIMRSEIPNNYLPGVTPILLIFSARLGLQLTGLELVGMTGKGTVEKLNADMTIAGSRPVHSGVRIKFFTDGDSEERSILYFEIRLSDRTLKDVTPEGLFFRQFRNFNTLIKSAVYLLHTPNFRELCADIMSRSAVIIQDDSGIPYRYFEKNSWEINLFGMYVYPQSLVTIPNPPYQPDLAESFKNRAQPLAFNFGYGVLAGKNHSNLMLAIKTNM